MEASVNDGYERLDELLENIKVEQPKGDGYEKNQPIFVV